VRSAQTAAGREIRSDGHLPRDGWKGGGDELNHDETAGGDELHDRIWARSAQIC
jgi:hypothetical protein